MSKQKKPAYNTFTDVLNDTFRRNAAANARYAARHPRSVLDEFNDALDAADALDARKAARARKK